jgi:hypothetical protein
MLGLDIISSQLKPLDIWFDFFCLLPVFFFIINNLLTYFLYLLMMSRKTTEMDEIDNEYLSYKWIILLGISTDESGQYK